MLRWARRKRRVSSPRHGKSVGRRSGAKVVWNPHLTLRENSRRVSRVMSKSLLKVASRCTWARRDNGSWSRRNSPTTHCSKWCLKMLKRNMGSIVKALCWSLVKLICFTRYWQKWIAKRLHLIVDSWMDRAAHSARVVVPGEETWARVMDPMGFWLRRDCLRWTSFSTEVGMSSGSTNSNHPNQTIHELTRGMLQIDADPNIIVLADSVQVRSTQYPFSTPLIHPIRQIRN